MLPSPRRPFLVETNPDSDEDPTVPSKLLLNLPDEVVPSSRGIPLHTRYTRRNQIQVTTFRKLVHVKVLANFHIMLNQDVMNVIEQYTFERTHRIIPHKRTEYPRSLFRDGDIHDLLTPCEQYANHSNGEENYIMHTLIGRILYGFDIHDSRYSTIDDPNPCEIMTNKGGMYLVPDQMSDWFLYKDGECVALPALQRFTHCITDARFIARSSGPFLRLVLKPVKSLIPVNDYMLQGTELGYGINYEDSDLESFTSSDIDLKLMNIAKSQTEDSLAVEIANCWNNTRESVLVVLSSPELKVAHFEESSDITHSVFSAVLTGDSDSDTSEEVADTVDFWDEYKEESEKENKDSDNRSQPCEPTVEFPLKKADHKDTSEDFVSSSTTSDTSITSLRLADFHSRKDDDERESGDGKAHFSFMSSRTSLIVDTDPQAPIIIELGAGVIGFPNLSMSYLHTVTTPNPHSYCSHCKDSSLENMEL